MNRISNRQVIEHVSRNLHIDHLRIMRENATVTYKILGIFPSSYTKNFNFYHVWTAFVNGRAENNLYEFAIQKAKDFIGDTIPIDPDKLENGKNAVRDQWHKTVNGDRESILRSLKNPQAISGAEYSILTDPEKYAVSPGNYLILQALFEGYFQPTREYKRIIEHSFTFASK